MISRANIPNALTRTARRIRLNSGGNTFPSRPDSLLEKLYQELEQEKPEHKQHHPLNELGFDIAELLSPNEKSTAFIKSQRERAHAPAKAAHEKLKQKIALGQVLDQSRQSAYEWALNYEQKDREIASNTKEYKKDTGYSARLLKELSALEEDASKGEDFLEKLERAEGYVDSGTVTPGGWTGRWKNTPIVGRVLNFIEGDNNAHVQDLDAIANELNVTKGKSQVGGQHLNAKMIANLSKDKPGLDKDYEAYKARARDFKKPHQKIISIRDGVSRLIEQGASEAEIQKYLLLAGTNNKDAVPAPSTSSHELTTEQKRAALKANVEKMRTHEQ
jgi:hypothetical protein